MKCSKFGSMIMRNVDKFALRIAIFNVFMGYLTSIGFPIIVDPLIVHFYGGGARTYHGFDFLFLLAIVIFLLTYLINSGCMPQIRSAFRKACFNFIAMLLTWDSFIIFGFRLQVLQCSLFFGLLTSLAVYVHYYELDFRMLDDESIAIDSKIEYVKMEYDIWMKILLATFAATSFASDVVFRGAQFQNFIKPFLEALTPEKTEQNIVFFAEMVIVICYIITFTMTLFYTFLEKLNIIKGKLKFIKVKP